MLDKPLPICYNIITGNGKTAPKIKGRNTAERGKIMTDEKMTMKQKQDVLRNAAFDKLNEGHALDEPILVGANEYAVRIDGSIIGLENQDCWVTVKFTVKNFVDSETREAYDALTEAEVYAGELEQKAKEAAAKKAERERKAAESKARREARKAKKEEKE